MAHYEVHGFYYHNNNESVFDRSIRLNGGRQNGPITGSARRLGGQDEWETAEERYFWIGPWGERR